MEIRGTDAFVAPGQTPARYSLRWRLPLVMAAVIGFVIAAFLAVAYREVKANLVEAAGTRAQATADQLAGLFAQSTQQRLNEIQRIAAHATVRRLFEQPIDDKWIRPFAPVTEADSLHDVLETLQRRGAHLARVVDADGATLGLATLEDVIEELVGEIRDAAHLEESV